MNRLAAAIALSIAPPSLANAGTFQDFNQGISAHNRGDNQTAIAAFTRALSAGDPNPSLLFVAYLDRGVAYLRTDRFSEALSDFDSAVSQKPDSVEAHLGRAGASALLGHAQLAADDCTTAASLGAPAPGVSAWCGRIFYMAGQYPVAKANIEAALRSDHASQGAAYNLLWLGIADLNMGKFQPSEFLAAERRLSQDGWPTPLLDVFAGKDTVEHARQASLNGSESEQRNHKCEVGFFMGIWNRAYRNDDAAKSLLQEAADTCPNESLEKHQATTELGRLAGP